MDAPTRESWLACVLAFEQLEAGLRPFVQYIIEGPFNASARSLAESELGALPQPWVWSQPYPSTTKGYPTSYRTWMKNDAVAQGWFCVLFGGDGTLSTPGLHRRNPAKPPKGVDAYPWHNADEQKFADIVSPNPAKQRAAAWELAKMLIGSLDSDRAVAKAKTGVEGFAVDGLMLLMRFCKVFGESVPPLQAAGVLDAGGPLDEAGRARNHTFHPSGAAAPGESNFQLTQAKKEERIGKLEAVLGLVERWAGLPPDCRSALATAKAQMAEMKAPGYVIGDLDRLLKAEAGDIKAELATLAKLPTRLDTLPAQLEQALAARLQDVQEQLGRVKAVTAESAASSSAAAASSSAAAASSSAAAAAGVVGAAIGLQTREVGLQNQELLLQQRQAQRHKEEAQRQAQAEQDRLEYEKQQLLLAAQQVAVQQAALQPGASLAAPSSLDAFSSLAPPAAYQPPLSLVPASPAPQPQQMAEAAAAGSSNAVVLASSAPFDWGSGLPQLAACIGGFASLDLQGCLVVASRWWRQAKRLVIHLSGNISALDSGEKLRKFKEALCSYLDFRDPPDKAELKRDELCISRACELGSVMLQLSGHELPSEDKLALKERVSDLLRLDPGVVQVVASEGSLVLEIEAPEWAALLLAHGFACSDTSLQGVFAALDPPAKPEWMSLGFHLEVAGSVTASPDDAATPPEEESMRQFDELVRRVLFAPDHFAALDVTRSATEREIVRAYHSVMRELHPDRQAPAPATPAAEESSAVAVQQKSEDTSLAVDGASLAAAPAALAALSGARAAEPAALDPDAKLRRASAAAEAARAALEEAVASSQRLGARAALHRLTEAAGTKGVLRDPARREAYVVQLQLQLPAVEFATCGELWVKDAMEELRLRRGAEEAEAAKAAAAARKRKADEPSPFASKKATEAAAAAEAEAAEAEAEAVEASRYPLHDYGCPELQEVMRRTAGRLGHEGWRAGGWPDEELIPSHTLGADGFLAAVGWIQSNQHRINSDDTVRTHRQAAKKETGKYISFANFLAAFIHCGHVDPDNIDGSGDVQLDAETKSARVPAWLNGDVQRGKSPAEAFLGLACVLALEQLEAALRPFVQYIIEGPFIAKARSLAESELGALPQPWSWSQPYPSKSKALDKDYGRWMRDDAVAQGWFRVLFGGDGTLSTPGLQRRSPAQPPKGVDAYPWHNADEQKFADIVSPDPAKQRAAAWELAKLLVGSLDSDRAVAKAKTGVEGFAVDGLMLLMRFCKVFGESVPPLQAAGVLDAGGPLDEAGRARNHTFHPSGASSFQLTQAEKEERIGKLEAVLDLVDGWGALPEDCRSAIAAAKAQMAEMKAPGYAAAATTATTAAAAVGLSFNLHVEPSLSADPAVREATRQRLEWELRRTVGSSGKVERLESG